MKKLFSILLFPLLLLSLAACGNSSDSGPVPVPTPESDPVTTSAPVTTPDPAPSDTPNDPAPIILTGDSYWVAYESEGDMRQDPPEGDDLLTDLTLWADGTARIREIENGIWLRSIGDERNMTWSCGEDGTLNLYTVSGDDTPYWTGRTTQAGIELNRHGGTYRFREEPMPEEGALYSPAELQGVWIQTGFEVEGYADNSLPGYFNSLIFRVEQSDGGQTLLASAESGDYSGFTDTDRYYGRGITLLDEPLYEGCGNDVWSVRIGEESPLNANGYPAETEIYVTLLDQNTLLQQHYFSFDGGPGVSYQTYTRILPETPFDPERADLAGSSFKLAGYIDADGVRHTEHPAYRDFSLRLYEDGGKVRGYEFTCIDDTGSEHRGGGHNWALGDGGTILMCDGDSLENWYAGAVRNIYVIPELYLFDNMGGILYLEQVTDGEGYADTMTDLEGNAFAAPENAALVFYGDTYFEQQGYETDWYRTNEDIPLHELADGPDVRRFLLTCVNDDTPVWIENDGFEIARFEPMMAGESIIIQMGYDGAHLCFEYGGIDYYIELSQSTLPLDMWDYITVAYQ